MADNFQITGLDAALAKLRNLKDPKRVRASVRSAGIKAMRIVRDSARSNAKALNDPETASTIHKEIVTQYSAKQSRGEDVVVKVGVRGGAKPQKGNTDTGHWRLLEFGTSNMAAQPFMRQALESNVTQVTEAFVAALEPAIDKQAAK